MGNSSDRKQDVVANAMADDYVVVCFMEDAGQANDCRVLLESNDIPALVQEQQASSDENTYALMVPEEFLDEAHVLLESQSSYDDFCDFALDEDEIDDFDTDVYNEEY